MSNLEEMIWKDLDMSWYTSWLANFLGRDYPQRQRKRSMTKFEIKSRIQPLRISVKDFLMSLLNI